MLTVLLSKVLGIFLMVVGAAVALRRNYFIPVVATFVEERLTRFVVGLAELLAGLFLVVTHNEWSSAPAAIVTLIGWLAVIESIAYMLLPDEVLEELIGALNKPEWYVGSGILSMILGLFLAGFGFG